MTQLDKAKDALFLVLRSFDYDGDEVIASFTVPQKAHDYAKEMAAKEDFCMSYDVVAVIPNTDSVVHCMSYRAEGVYK